MFQSSTLFLKPLLLGMPAVFYHLGVGDAGRIKAQLTPASK
jgi:hypothetical protein